MLQLSVQWAVALIFLLVAPEPVQGQVCIVGTKQTNVKVGAVKCGAPFVAATLLRHRRSAGACVSG
jgi:hypothetical protein